MAEVLGLKGVRCLDAPVSGGEAGAMNATLSIMVGGPEDLFDEVKPVFEVMGKTVTLCGGNGAGQTVKACNQIQVALNFIGMAEAFVLGAKAVEAARQRIAQQYGVIQEAYMEGSIVPEEWKRESPD